jgi:uncharacterized protein YjbI with pentapeptide repeats
MILFPGKRRRAMTSRADKVQSKAVAQQQNAQALLAAANSASERLAGQHMAFMAVCVYVLVIVFGTTDLDLLIGRGVKLPVINVDVPIAGFYAFAPFLVVLVHFNLLLQLQLLSRELFAFAAAVPEEEVFGGLRDRLHTFPYTYFLVGKLSILMQRLIGVMVSITMLLLPLITLIALQFWFLAYQSEPVTWLQRIALWIDIAVVTILWPIILDPQDNWRRYWRDIVTTLVPRRRVWIAFGVLLLGHLLFSFSAAGEKSQATHLPLHTVSFALGYALVLLSPPLLILLSAWKNVPRLRKLHFCVLFLLVVGLVAASIGLRTDQWIIAAIFAVPWLFVPLAMFWHPQSPRGSLGLLLTLYLGPLLPLTLHVDGERIEQILLHIQGLPHGSTTLSSFLTERRRLDLTEQVLLAKPASPATLLLVHSGEGEKALHQTEPIDINHRKLRNAHLFKAILIGANLRETDIQGAYLMEAHLQGARLYGASLQDAVLGKTNLQHVGLGRADLQSAYLGDAHLQGADLPDAQLQGADLQGAQLLGANLKNACLQGAILSRAQLQGADLQGADLQGADLRDADLRGADLRGTHLQGANLSRAQLYGATIEGRDEALVDARTVGWDPMGEALLNTMITEATRWIPDKESLQSVIHRLQQATASQTTGSSSLRLHSCLTGSDEISCTQRFAPQHPEDLDRFRQQLHVFLGTLACSSPHVAWGIIQQSSDREEDSSRNGLGVSLKQRLDDTTCRGVQELRAEKKEQLRARVSGSVP